MVGLLPQRSLEDDIGLSYLEDPIRNIHQKIKDYTSISPDWYVYAYR